MVENDIINDYIIFKISIKNLSLKYKISIYKVRKILLDSNTQIRTTKETSRKYNVNSHYFNKIDTEDKAYWLGFIYADGNISIKERRLSIKLSIKDKSHIEKFITHTESNYPIFVGENKTGYGKGNMFCQLNMIDSELIEDLIDCGCMPNKTKIINFPNINIVPDNFIRHFIRGYFDGDGSISYSLSKRYQYPNIYLEFLGTFNMIKNIKDKVLISSSANITKKKNIYNIKFSGYKNIKFVYEYLYKDCSISLDRKKIKFNEIFEIYDNYQRNKLSEVKSTVITL